MSQLFEKYGFSADKICFLQNGDISLYFGEARCLLGSMDNIDEKMMKLKSVIDSIKGLSGELHLENYSVDKDEGYITFERDDS